jgi:alpha-L-fucosidase 2
MKTGRRGFLKATGAAAATIPLLSRNGCSSQEDIDAFAIAQRHKILRESPTPDFFEGMLLGNGDVGVCVTVRPDALGLHIGKEDSWDIRVSEEHYKEVLPFQELLKLWQRASEEAKRQGKPDMVNMENTIDFLRQYNEKMTSSYRKPWPRPWPCGIVWIHWDSRMVRVVRQTLDPASGLLAVDLDHDNLRGDTKRVRVLCFVSWSENHVSVSTDMPAPFLSVAYYPYREREAELPAAEINVEHQRNMSFFSCYQHFPALAPTVENPHPHVTEMDSSFALHGLLSGEWSVEDAKDRASLKANLSQPFRLDLTLFTPRDKKDHVAHARSTGERLSRVPVSSLQRDSESYWKEFWSHSAVEFEDKELERIWYHNQYFLACCLREGRVAPGLFGNWTSGRIGTAWHGDYHMNYNTQQVFWGVFSSNHVDQHLPYVDLCEKLFPMAEAFARDKFGLPGAFFPHSAYPVPSMAVPYPALPWGYEVCETPWTVQSLWWHYQYTRDKDFLKRVYPLMRAAVRFLAAYLKRGPDGKYHVIPTVSPENWGCTVDYRLNRDCIMDLALIEFILDAAAEASRILSVDEGERKVWAELRAKTAPYPKAVGPYGEVWLDVDDAPVEYVYNIPVTLAPVFPGEQVGLDLHQEYLEIARRTARVIRLEGGNDLIFQPLIRARLGMLDLEWFKREVRYCLLPNGVCNDRTRQVGGRYSDLTDVDFMMRMGVWTENLSLPVVLNECLLQSYSGVIHIFPNTKGLGPARFRNLRAVGAFLVSGAWDGKEATVISIFSEKGIDVRLASPWGTEQVRVIRSRDGQSVPVRREETMLRFETEAGATYRVERA